MDKGKKEISCVETKWKFSGEKMHWKKKKVKRVEIKWICNKKEKEMEEWKMSQEYRIFTIDQEEYLIKKLETGPKCLIEKLSQAKCNSIITS